MIDTLCFDFYNQNQHERKDVDQIKLNVFKKPLGSSQRLFSCNKALIGRKVGMSAVFKVKTIATIYLILCILFSLIAMASFSYFGGFNNGIGINTRSSFDVFKDNLAVIWIVGTPIGLGMSSMGLFSLKQSGILRAIYVSVALSVAFFVVGIIGLYNYEGGPAPLVLLLASLFTYCAFFLGKVKKEFSE